MPFPRTDAELVTMVGRDAVEPQRIIADADSEQAFRPSGRSFSSEATSYVQPHLIMPRWGSTASRPTKNESNSPPKPPTTRLASRSTIHHPRSTAAVAFTLTELLVVLMIIAILTSLLFPAFQGVREQGKRLQARNDLLQITTAIHAYYSEYGRYPLTPATPADTTYGSSNLTNDLLFNVLRAVSTTDNPRGIVFLAAPEAKDPSHPRNGISSSSGSIGQFFDPWGNPYLTRLDTDYDNQVRNPYSQNAGSSPLLRTGAIAWSYGKDGQSQSLGTPTDKNGATNKDDIVSWQ